MINMLPLDSFEVDLLLPGGFDEIMTEQIPKRVNILPVPTQLSKYSDGLMRRLREEGRGHMADVREKVHEWNEKYGEDAFRNWKELKNICPAYHGYDTAVAYEETMPLKIIADRVEAKTKIAWIHWDYREHPEDWRKNQPEYLGRMDRIVFVSSQNAEVFGSFYPEFAPKQLVLPNIIDKRALEAGARAFYPAEYESGDIKIFTAANIQRRKGMDFIIDAVKLLIGKKYDFRWYIAGLVYKNGGVYVDRIKAEGLENTIVLLGKIQNPLPYTLNCDIYCQPSRTEGQSAAIVEAKILGRPIVTTKHSGVEEILTDGETCLLCEMNAESLAEKLMLLIDDAELRNGLSGNLSAFEPDNRIEDYLELIGTLRDKRP
jgi:glycosyltransferase involved in cell wall biosynthesis